MYIHDKINSFFMSLKDWAYNVKNSIVITDYRINLTALNTRICSAIVDRHRFWDRRRPSQHSIIAIFIFLFAEEVDGFLDRWWMHFPMTAINVQLNIWKRMMITSALHDNNCMHKAGHCCKTSIFNSYLFILSINYACKVIKYESDGWMVTHRPEVQKGTGSMSTLLPHEVDSAFNFLGGNLKWAVGQMGMQYAIQLNRILLSLHL